MITLALETSGKTFSIAAARDNILAGEVFWHTDFNHSEKLIPAVSWLLDNLNIKLEEVNRVAVSTGPGSFTGIRVGMSCAKTLAQNLGIGLVCSDTFDILSKNLDPHDRLVIPVIDALRDEVFVKMNNKILTLMIEEFCGKLNAGGKKVILTGSALAKNADKIRKLLLKKTDVVFSSEHFPRAGVLALMAEKKKTVKYNLAKPLYIRRSWADEKKGGR